MADLTITELPADITLTGTEEVPIMDGGITKKTTVQNIANLAAGGVSSVNGETGAVVLDAADVGADAAGTASGLIAAHVAAAYPGADRGGNHCRAYSHRPTAFGRHCQATEL